MKKGDSIKRFSTNNNMNGMLVFQTDFTYKEGAVCSMYGVVKSVDRSIEIIDGTHEIPQYDTWSASYRLYQSMKFWPEGTVFVSVVDPGVGTPRKACVAKTADGYYIVTPDNGSLTHIKQFVGITEIREIDETINRLKGKGTEGTSIFHGRDLFAYCGARLTSEVISFEEVGQAYPVEDIIVHPILEPTISDGCAQGMFEIEDPNFGNLWSNIPTNDFLKAGFSYGDFVTVSIEHAGKEVFKETVLFEKSFGFANKGDVMIYNNELMKISMAMNQASFIKTYGLSFGSDWTVTFTK